VQIAKDYGSTAERIAFTARRGNLQSIAELIDTVASEALVRLRSEQCSNGQHATTQALDHWFRADRQELLERKWMAPSVRSVTMRALDFVNYQAGAYPLWANEVFRVLKPMKRAHVHDLCCGRGGFAEYLQNHAPAELCCRVSASDKELTHLPHPYELQRIGGVHFEQRELDDLRHIKDVDLFVCTQALHHLSPGQVVRVFANTIVHAPLGMVCIDLVRSPVVAGAVGAFLGAVLPIPFLVLDGITSVRRAYSISELSLLARLAGASIKRAHRSGPVYLAVHIVAHRNKLTCTDTWRKSIAYQ